MSNCNPPSSSSNTAKSAKVLQTKLVYACKILRPVSPPTAPITLHGSNPHSVKPCKQALYLWHRICGIIVSLYFFNLVLCRHHVPLGCQHDPGGGTGWTACSRRSAAIVSTGGLSRKFRQGAEFNTVQLSRARQSYPPSLLQVQAVLQNAIDKLALMSVILVDPTMQAQQLTQSVGEEISRMITQQKQLEQRFQELIAAQPALRAMANKKNLHNNQTELQEVSAALKQATKQLCRNLRDNPNVSENMAKVAAQRETLQVLFSNTIDSLLLHGTVQPVIEAVLAAEQAEVRGCPAGY